MENNQYLYLVKVEANANNNKYYKMIQLDESNFKVEYGRIGNSSFQSASYSMYQWNKKLKEKIKKGYVDQTRLVAEAKVETKSNKYIEIEDVSIRNIVNRLQSMARQAIKDNYTVSSSNVTQLMIDEAQLTLNKLMNPDNDIIMFNNILIDLFKIIPRKMSRVSDYLAKTIENYAKIIQSEQDLLDVMKGQVVQEEISKETNKNIEDLPTQTILEAMGLIIENVTSEDEDLIKFNLGSISNRYYQSWKITNLKSQAKYDKFIKDNNIKSKKMLFHGSRNENWWSIINTSLVLRPSAVITGKMFGYGIYFAPKAQKSLGYTSLDGSYWVRGNSSSGFMALYDVAYGKPYDVYSFEREYQDLTYDKLQQKCENANCLHAHSEKGMLKNDEIVVYKEDQLTIKYLIELK